MNSPAFKEWHVIVEALGAGEQIIILRKGGIAEGRGGFEVTASRFWLFPTRFHAQVEKTKPAAARWFSAPPPNTVDLAALSSASPVIPLRYFADVVSSKFLTDWADVARLDPRHLWTATTVRERFEWSEPAGLHVLVVRVHRLSAEILLAPTPEMSGCKSWIEIPYAFDEQPSEPVLPDAVFQRQFAALPP